jgi:4-hydroxy-4-methyl-2-oxoglutarate aldolase
MAWETDQELFGIVRERLFTAVIGDVMDQLGLHDQFLPPSIRALRSDMVLAGRAMPVLEADTHTVTSERATNPVMGMPFGLMFAALDDLGPGEVYLCTGASPRYALWGELMTARASRLGAAGAVLDGYVRDSRALLGGPFPVFSYGSYGQDQGPRGKVVDFRTRIRIGATWVDPGDVVVGDVDGVCVVPRAAEQEVFRLALEKVDGENLVRQAIEGGMGTVEAFERFGIM